MCRTQGEIKGASPFIDCIKIGLHLQLSRCCCLFVCLDKSCDLAEGTQRLLGARGTGGEEGGGVEREKEREERGIRREKQNHIAAKVGLDFRSSCCLLFFWLLSPLNV